MRNKELKAGDKVWIYEAYMSRTESGYVVKSIKKSGTLVSIVVEAEGFDGKLREFKMYGHCNSRILSGFDRTWGHDYTCYTCDYSLIIRKTQNAEREERVLDAGRALLNLVKFLK